MPEMIFRVRWPDGQESDGYSPSLGIQDHLTPGQNYPVRLFREKAQTALSDASGRVRGRYGFPCSRALGQLQAIEQSCAPFLDRADAQVSVLSFKS